MSPSGLGASVLVPVLNEGAHIEGSIAAMLSQRFERGIEVLVVDGGSEDRTPEIVERVARADSRVRLLSNPQRRIPNALNIGLRHARGEYVARMDAHAYYPPDYIARAVERLEAGGFDCVSGPALPHGEGRWSRRVALALRTPLGMGGASVFRNAAREIEVDNAFTGVWRRNALLELGGWDEGWPVNEDTELAARIREAGGRYVCIPAMAARYVPRNSLPKLARQYYRYGMYRSKTARHHPITLRRSHIFPPGVVLVMCAAALAPARARRVARVGLLAYAGALAIGTTRAAADGKPADLAALPLVFATLHLSWGTGFLFGCVRFGPPLAALAGLAGSPLEARTEAGPVPRWRTFRVRKPASDVAIYAPEAASLYERSPNVTGGAERQTTLLASGLAAAGLRVAHIVLPLEDPDPGLEASVTLVQRRLVTTERGPVARAIQLRQVWSALAEADAKVYVFRSGLPALGITALFCRAHCRRLVFAGSNDLDFTLQFYAGRRPEVDLYKFGVRNADVVVVQTQRQAKLAHGTFPRLSRVVELPSFAQSAALSTARPEAFFWAGRLDATKQPLRYLDLAEAIPDARFWMVARRLDPERTGGSPVAGGGVDFTEEVHRRAAGLPNLEILEQRPHGEAMKLVERSVAVVNTGLAEGMPNLFLEAWARGIPVLSYEFDPDSRISQEGLGMSAGGSPERFQDGARRLWEGRNDRRELATRVRSYVQSTHGVDAVTKRWVELVTDLRAA